MIMGEMLDKIKEFTAAPKRRQFITGAAYYNTENEAIMERKFQVAYKVPKKENQFDIKVRQDAYKANNKIPSSWYKLLVDQKVGYLLKSPPVYTPGKQGQAEEIKQYFGQKWHRVLRKAARMGSVRGLAWGHPYIVKDELKIKIVGPENTFPVYDEEGEELLEVYRFWEEKDENKRKFYRVEKWTAKDVTEYRIDDTGKETVTKAARPHIVTTTQYGKNPPTTTSSRSWDRVPFFPLHNSDDDTYDLKPVKPLIDAYDKVDSDFANNLEDFQDIFWVLKGYDGTNLETFLNEVKEFKAVKVGEGGDAKPETINIPYEARKTFMEGAKADIMQFGMGLNTDELSGGSLTNVVIKARYANLDLKTDSFQPFVEDFIEDYLYFVNQYRGGEQISLDVEFNRTQIINEAELLDANKGQMGVVSDETRLENHPWVDDVGKEMKRDEAEKKKAAETFGGFGQQTPLEDGEGEA